MWQPKQLERLYEVEPELADPVIKGFLDKELCYERNPIWLFLSGWPLE